MVLDALIRVFSNVGYLAIAFLVAGLAFAVATLLPNVQLLISVLGASDIAVAAKILLVMNLLGSITTNFTVISAITTVAISLLFGMNAAMTVYVIRGRLEDVSRGALATGSLGALMGVVGLGCAACGSFLLLNFLALFSATSLLAFLPLRGVEFHLVALMLLVLAIILAAKKIAQPQICEISS